MTNIKNFFTNYVHDLLAVVQDYDKAKLHKIYNEIEKAIFKKKKFLFVVMVVQQQQLITLYVIILNL